MKNYSNASSEVRKLYFNIAQILMVCAADSSLLNDNVKLSEHLNLSAEEIATAIDYFFQAIIKNANKSRLQEKVPIFKDIFDTELHEYLYSLDLKMPKQKIGQIHLALHALLSGDYNKVHLDKDLAEKSKYGDVIVYGPLMSSVSTGSIHKIFDSKQAIYPIQVIQKVRNLKPMYANQEIEFKFKTKSVVLKNQNIFNPARLEVLYEIVGCVNGKQVIGIDWKIYYLH